MLKKYAKRVYPKALAKVKATKYKILDFDGYYLLDDVIDGKVPNIFYHGKWRETQLSELTLLKQIRGSLKRNLYLSVLKIKKVNEVVLNYRFTDYSWAYFDFENEKMICTPRQQRAIELYEFDTSLLANKIVLGMKY